MCIRDRDRDHHQRGHVSGGPGRARGPAPRRGDRQGEDTPDRGLRAARNARGCPARFGIGHHLDKAARGGLLMQPAMRRWGTGRPLRLVTAAVLATVLSMVLAAPADTQPVSYTHLRAHETPEHLVCRLL